MAHLLGAILFKKAWVTSLEENIYFPLSSRMKVSGPLSEKIRSFSFLCAGMVVGIHVSGMDGSGNLLWFWNRVGHYGIFLIAVPFFFLVNQKSHPFRMALLI